MVGLLMTIVMYMYALVGFAFLRNIFHDNKLFCDTLAECFATIIREGLLYGLTEVSYHRLLSLVHRDSRMLGTTRESVSQQFEKMRNNGEAAEGYILFI